MEEIRYESKELERLCNDDRYCTGKLGLPGKKKVWARMAELEAAPTVGDLPKAGDPHPLERELEGFFAVSLDGGRRLIFKPVVPAPRDGRGRIDWRRVSRITITAIKDYHRG